MSFDNGDVRAFRLRDLAALWSKRYFQFLIGGVFWFFIIGGSLAWIMGDFYSDARFLIILSMMGGATSFAVSTASEFWVNPDSREAVTQQAFSVVQFGVLFLVTATYSIALVAISTILAAVGMLAYQPLFLLALLYPFVDMELVERFSISPAFIPVLALTVVLVVLGITNQAVEEVIELVRFRRIKTH
jgi:hypothetical protein